jgi:hypothetical protein
MFPMLLTRFPRLRRDGDAVRRPGISIHSYVSLPVAVD